MVFSKIVNYFLLILITFFFSCTKSGVGKIFTLNSPYEKYLSKLMQSQIDQTAMGNDWISAGVKALSDTFLIEVPFKEVGYFSEENIRAVSYKFLAKEGEVIVINGEWESRNSGKVFIDLFDEEALKQEKIKPLSSADSTINIRHEVKSSGLFLLRIQPELLRGGKYTIFINYKPSVIYPIPGKDSRTVGSFFGVDRDRGVRKHEGIDIFVPKRTPVIAVANGRVASVKENKLGGKVVFLNDSKRNISYYYAHLDSQLVAVGEKVTMGDTIGLVGNTGNAKYTPPHLHFGIYTWGRGAIDPFPFVARANHNFPTAEGKASYLNAAIRTKDKKTPLYIVLSKKALERSIISKNTYLTIIALSGKYYRVLLPNKEEAYIKINQAEAIDAPIKTRKIKTNYALLDFPDRSGIVKDSIPSGTNLKIYAKFDDYVKVAYGDNSGWIYDALK